MREQLGRERERQRKWGLLQQPISEKRPPPPTSKQSLKGRRLREAVDALFVDIILNGDPQAGLELAKRAVELKPRLKVVYSTGLSVTDDMKALFVPGSAVLEKPYTVDQLLTSFSVHFQMGPQHRVRD